MSNDNSNVEKAVATYRKLRDSKDEIKARHAEELKPINDGLFKLETWLLSTLNDIGANSIKTESGTAYKSTITHAKISDWDASLKFVIENNLWHMLERRVSKTAVEEYIESKGTAPPGVEVNVEVRVNVRRS